MNFMVNNPRRADQIMAQRAGVSYEQFQLFKAGTKMFDLEQNREAFAKSNDMKSLPYAAREIQAFLLDNQKSLDKMPNLNKLFDGHFIENISSSAATTNENPVIYSNKS
jgi:NitT/TauT family transport system substrate-binding protein